MRIQSTFREPAPSLMRTVNVPVASRILGAAAFVLILSGLFHICVWTVLGGPWEGAVSWRKPILFGVSTGMTVLSIGWVFAKLQPRRWDSIVAGLFGGAMLVEVALISVQQWRGEASHFNRSSVFNTLVESWMTYLITFATLILIEITRRCFLKLRVPNDMKIAIRSGMMFLVISCLIGFVILFYGSTQESVGADPSTFGKNGVTKFPHGVAIHSIQLFPFACWIMQKLGLLTTERTRLISFLVAATGTILAFSLVQTLLGKARFEMTIFGALLLMTTMFLLLPIAKSLLVKVWSTVRQC